MRMRTPCSLHVLYRRRRTRRVSRTDTRSLRLRISRLCSSVAMMRLIDAHRRCYGHRLRLLSRIARREARLIPSGTAVSLQPTITTDKFSRVIRSLLSRTIGRRSQHTRTTRPRSIRAHGRCHLLGIRVELVQSILPPRWRRRRGLRIDEHLVLLSLRRAAGALWKCTILKALLLLRAVDSSICVGVVASSIAQAIIGVSWVLWGRLSAIRVLPLAAVIVPVTHDGQSCVERVSATSSSSWLLSSPDHGGRRSVAETR
jgi:hypothetical protein